MTKNFLALVKTPIEERLEIKDTLVNMYIDPVYENGMEFSGEVLIRGTITDNVDDGTLAAIIQDYLNEYVEFSRVIQVQFNTVRAKKIHGTYRRAS